MTRGGSYRSKKNLLHFWRDLVALIRTVQAVSKISQNLIFGEQKSKMQIQATCTNTCSSHPRLALNSTDSTCPQRVHANRECHPPDSGGTTRSRMRTRRNGVHSHPQSLSIKARRRPRAQVTPRRWHLLLQLPRPHRPGQYAMTAVNVWTRRSCRGPRPPQW